MLSKKNRERQAALPLPELGHSSAGISLKGATVAHLRIDKLATMVSETLSAAS
ncbi:hypothetical protein ACFP76_17510 [Paracoccus aerius]|uniref:hypothetical protein n=1 Tax=Paracoccus aerius TaxID=1915382 RepID=UPI00360C8302